MKQGNTLQLSDNKHSLLELSIEQLALARIYKPKDTVIDNVISWARNTDNLILNLYADVAFLYFENTMENVINVCKKIQSQYDLLLHYQRTQLFSHIQNQITQRIKQHFLKKIKLKYKLKIRIL